MTEEQQPLDAILTLFPDAWLYILLPCTTCLFLFFMGCCCFCSTFLFFIYSAASCRVKIGEFLHQKHSLKGALLQSPACAVLYKCAKGCVRRGLQQHKLRNSMWRPLQETAKKMCFISLICSQCQKKTKLLDKRPKQTPDMHKN